MKSSTESLISALRVLALDVITDDGVVNSCLEEAAGRLEELDRANKNTLADLALAVSERTPHDYGLLKGEVEHLKRELTEAIRERNKTVSDLIKQRDEALKNQQPTTVVRQVTTRPEPSRLEIAAMCLQGMVSSGSWGQSAAVVALEYTDKLIAAAKEVQS